MKIASILSIVALIASMATNGCSEDGPVTNPRQEEPQKVVKMKKALHVVQTLSG